MNFCQKKLLVIGHVARDVVKSEFGSGSFWGGAGYHVALAAGLFLPEKSVILKSVVGHDFDFSGLKKVGVNIDLIKIDDKNRTDKHMLDERGKIRLYTSEGSLSQGIDLDDLEKIKKEEIGRIHLASSPPPQQLEWIEQIKSAGLGQVPLSCDTFDTFARENPELVLKVMERCDLGFANEGEWLAIRGEKMKINMVLKLGAKGAEYYENGKRKAKALIKKKEVVVKDTTGAGDVAAGVFLALRLRGFLIEKSLEEACRVATVSVEEFGTEHLVGRAGFGDDFAIKTDRD